jgi:hypothetical protein
LRGLERNAKHRKAQPLKRSAGTEGARKISRGREQEIPEQCGFKAPVAAAIEFE